jgi:lauroyl/myristoyl acyltransferase
VRFRVSAQQPIRSSDPAASVAQQARDMMQQVNRVLETWIVARPGSWQCLKRRWSKDQVRQRLSADAMVGPGGPRASAIGGSS